MVWDVGFIHAYSTCRYERSHQIKKSILSSKSGGASLWEAPPEGPFPADAVPENLFFIKDTKAESLPDDQTAPLWCFPGFSLSCYFHGLKSVGYVCPISGKRHGREPGAGRFPSHTLPLELTEKICNQRKKAKIGSITAAAP